VIVDSSALVAILRSEPDRAAFEEAIAHEVCKVSAATALETAIVVQPHRHEDVDQLLDEAQIEVVAFDSAQAKIARAAYARFGKKSGSKAQLNFGDCMAYALAKALDEPLLFKGDDFTHTDITQAR